MPVFAHHTFCRHTRLWARSTASAGQLVAVCHMAHLLPNSPPARPPARPPRCWLSHAWDRLPDCCSATSSTAAFCAYRIDEAGIEEHGLTSNSSQEPWWRQEGAARQPASPFFKDVNNHIRNSNTGMSSLWQGLVGHTHTYRHGAKGQQLMCLSRWRAACFDPTILRPMLYCCSHSSPPAAHLRHPRPAHRAVLGLRRLPPDCGY